MHHPRPIVALLVAGLVAGCAPSSPTATPTSTPIAVPTPTPTSDATAVPTAAPLELRATGDPLPAGRYAALAFEPPILLAVDGSWQASRVVDGSFDLQYAADPALATVQVLLVTFVRGGSGDVEPATPADAMAAIRQNGSIDVVEASESRMGGLTGAQVTVERPGDAEPGAIDVVPVLSGQNVGLVLPVGRRLWIAFFEAPQGLVAIVVGGSIERWDAALAVAEPVLESIAFGAP